MSNERPISHEFEGEGLESVFIGRRDGKSLPTILMVPTVMGVSDLEKASAGSWSSSATTLSSSISSARNFTARRATRCSAR